jgi:hypothetical protein
MAAESGNAPHPFGVRERWSANQPEWANRLHEIWTWAVHRTGYNKCAWRELESSIRAAMMPSPREAKLEAALREIVCESRVGSLSLESPPGNRLGDIARAALAEASDPEAATLRVEQIAREIADEFCGGSDSVAEVITAKLAGLVDH